MAANEKKRIIPEEKKPANLCGKEDEMKKDDEHFNQPVHGVLK